jgi:hypothetical protein
LVCLHSVVIEWRHGRLNRCASVRRYGTRLSSFQYLKDTYDMTKMRPLVRAWPNSAPSAAFRWTTLEGLGLSRTWTLASRIGVSKKQPKERIFASLPAGSCGHCIGLLLPIAELAGKDHYPQGTCIVDLLQVTL